jgi:hypothetical protein
MPVGPDGGKRLELKQAEEVPMRARNVPLKLLLLCLWLLSILIIVGQGFSKAPESGVRVTLLAPPNGLITLSPSVEVKGTASTEAPEIKIDVVIVSVNGVAQKAELKADGSFQATTELAYGENIISAVAVASNNEIGSDKVSVILQREVLFFDDFEGTRVRAEWARVTGNWILEEQDPETRNKGFTVEEQDYGLDIWERGGPSTNWAFTGGGFAWQNYTAEVDVFNNTGWFYYGYPLYFRQPQKLYIAVRARDPQNLVAFEVMSDALGAGNGNPYEGWMCWRVMRGGIWSDCLNIVKPSPPPNFRLRIEARGDLLTAYINGAPISSWRDRGNEFPQGAPGLGIWHKFKGAKGAFDNFKVISLEARGPAPAYTGTGELPKPPTQISAEEWQKTVSQIDQEIKPTMVTLQASLGGHELKLKDLSGRVGTLESALGEQLDPLKLTVEKLDSRYSVIENKVEGLSKLFAKIPLDIDLTLNSLQERSRAYEKEIQALKKDLRGIENTARLGLIAGATGLVLAGLVALGLIG